MTSVYSPPRAVPTGADAPVRERPPYLWAAGTGVLVFLIYLATLSPTTAFWDTSEYIAAARVLGIPHPPGNPLFTILAHTWGLLPLAAEYATRINLFAAFTSAAAAALWFLVADRWLRTLVPVRWARLAAAFAGVLVGATAWTVWNQSVVNEKVYTISMLSIALVMWIGVHWGDDAPGPHRDRWVILIAYLLALTSTNHMMGVLAAPAVGIYILWTDWRVLTRPWVIAGVVVAVLVGISLNYLWLPMRAAQFPPINEGEPIGFFSKALSETLGRAQYGKPSVFDRQADFGAQIANYVQYYNWQFAFDWAPALRSLFTLIFTALGLYGLVELIRKDRRAGIAALTLLLTLTAALIFYLNFKYGFSQYPDQPALPREVRERDYFFMASFQMFGVLVALGVGAVMTGIVRSLRDRGTEASRWAMAAPILVLAFIPILANHASASRAHERLARDFAADMMESVEPYGILITAGDNDTFPLWYAQEVERIRPDVTLANLSLMNTRWHLRQLRRRETPTFDPNRSVALWGRDTAEVAKRGPVTWPKPTTPVFSITEAQLDSLPEVMSVPKGGGIRVDSLEIAFGQEYLTLQDLATIFLIRDNLGKRPIYFSWSDGGYPDQTLGLTPYLVSQGLVRRLMPKEVQPGGGLVLSRGMGYVDVPRTERLLWDVYHWQSAARDRPKGWVDVPSASILSLYSIVYGGAAAVLRDAGKTAEAAKADSISQAIQTQIRKGESHH